MTSTLVKFFKSESAVGIVLIIATILAMIMANSPLSSIYEELIETPVVVVFGEFNISKPLLLWINDGLMAIFFLLIGLGVAVYGVILIAAGLRPRHLAKGSA